MRLPIVLLACLLPLAACTAYPPPAIGPGPNPYPPPPPPNAETVPLSPVSETPLVWRIGEWEWVGSGYAWQPGQWEPIGTHSNEFMPGHWSADNGTWTWVRGHWM
jgi:hypothetical protein